MEKRFSEASLLERSIWSTQIATTWLNHGVFCSLPEYRIVSMLKAFQLKVRLSNVVLPRLALAYVRRLRRHGLLVLAPVCLSAESSTRSLR